MKIVIAPDSFKGSLSAAEVCQAVVEGIRRVLPEAEIVTVPMADGGEGTVASLVAATEGRFIRRTVTGPIGESVEAFFGVLGDGKTAVIEMAAASGLPLVPESKRDPRIATTFGTGELIIAALDEGCQRIIVGIGGSATNDGGVGMAQALGFHFLDLGGLELPPGGAALANLAKIDATKIDPRLHKLEILVACDVTNVLTGPDGAASVYGPQKGATPVMVVELDWALNNLSEIVARDLKKNIRDLPGGGAAGGLGAGLVAFLNGKLGRGVETVMKIVKLAEKIADADLVITGEGRIDGQTVCGKTPWGVAQAAKAYQIPVLPVGGSLGPGVEKVYGPIDGLLPIITQPMSLAEAILHAKPLVTEAAERLLRIYLARKC